MAENFYCAAYDSNPLDGLVANIYDVYSGTTWANIRSVLGIDAQVNEYDSVTQLNLSCSRDSGWYFNYRPVFFFTVTAPIYKCIYSASLNIYITGKGNTLSLSDANAAIITTGLTTVSNTSLEKEDFTTYTTTKYASDILYSSVSENSWLSIPFNASGIAAINNLGGYTKVGLRIATDYNNIEPSFGSYAQTYYTIRTADYGIDYRPYISIVWKYEDSAKFRYRINDTIYSVCTLVNNPGGNFIKVRNGTISYYLPLVLTSHPDASNFRIRFGSQTYAGILIL